MFLLFTECCFSKKKSELTIINPNRLRGKCFIGYCHGHETFIFIIRLDDYKEQYKRILPIKFRYS